MRVCKTLAAVVSWLVVAEAAGCNSQDSAPTSAASTPAPAEPPSTAPVVPPPPAREPATTTHGELAGMRYLEHMTGGAQPDERVPMIVALHPMGGDPADFLPLLLRYHRRARLILPYGHPSGGMYIWYDFGRDDVAGTLVTAEAERIAAALAALVAALPTVGKPLVTGFSQGGIMAFALAVTHPEALAAAFPISGVLPPPLYPSAALSSGPRPATLPPVVAFHGGSDLAVPTEGARTSIAELRHAGYSAELHEYAGIEHDISNQEMAEILERIGRAADSLAAAAPAP
jgi:phospholipase/carboxylesterase